MIKFDTLYSDNNTYPITLQNFFSNLCQQVGLQAGSTSIVNGDYEISGNPFTNNETCKTVLSAIAQLCGGFAHIGRDNKVYIVNLQNNSNELTVEEVHTMTVSELNETLMKNTVGTKTSDTLDGNNYDTSFKKNNVYGEVNSLILRLSDDIEGENTVREDADSIQTNGLTEITISGNDFLISEAEREKVIDAIWDKLKGIEYLPFETTYYGFPYLDVGDKITVYDIKDNIYESYVFNHTFTYNGAFSGKISTKALNKTQTQYKNVIKSKFRRVELLVDKINGEIRSVIEEVEENTERVSEVVQTVDSITSTVRDIETDLSGNYYTKTQTDSQIQQSADSITSTVTSNVTKNIKVDSDNLLLNTALKENANHFSLPSGITRVTDKLTPNNNYCFHYNITGLTADAWRNANPDLVAVAEGDTVTASANVYIPSGVTNSAIRLEIQCYNSSNTRVGFYTSDANLSLTDQWQRIYLTKTVPSGTVKANARVYVQRNGECWVGDLKLGKGNVISAWCPSSKDYSTTEEMNSAIQQKADSITSTVSQTYATKDSLGNYSTTSQVQSMIKQTASSIDLSVTNNSTTAGIKITLKDANGNTVDSDTGTINMTGLVKFTDLSTSGSTTINGANITTGTISANRLDTSTINATSGSIGGININSTGIYYSGSGSYNGFGLWKNGIHSDKGSYIIFHAGGNSSNIAGANLRIYQNGDIYTGNIIVEGKDSDNDGLTDTGLYVKGKQAFVDLCANNSSSYTTRIIDYSDVTMFCADHSFTFVNRGNSAFQPIAARYFNIGGTPNKVYADANTLLLCANSGTRVVNADNSAFQPIQASSFNTASSLRYKENINDMSEEEANKILDVNVVTFDYKKESMMTGKNIAGVIAEEIYKIIPNCVTLAEIDGDMVPDSVDYTKLDTYIIKELQLLNKRLKKLEAING